MAEITKTKEAWLTTIDNPVDPFSDFDEWYRVDQALGHNTTSYIDRLYDVKDDEERLERAIDEIVANNSDLYVKLYGTFSDQFVISNTPIDSCYFQGALLNSYF